MTALPQLALSVMLVAGSAGTSGGSGVDGIDSGDAYIVHKETKSQLY